MRMFKKRSHGFSIYLGENNGTRRIEAHFGHELVARKTITSDGSIVTEYWPGGEDEISHSERFTKMWFEQRQNLKVLNSNADEKATLQNKIHEKVSSLRRKHFIYYYLLCHADHIQCCCI